MDKDGELLIAGGRCSHYDPAMLSHLWPFIYKELPDFSGILLAAVGIALAVAPNFIDKIANKWRWVIAGSLFVLGLGGVYFSFAQRQESDNQQQTLQKTVNSYGPKLDAILKNPNCAEQKGLAKSLKDALFSQLPSLRPKYSTTQTLNTLPPNMGGNALIHLDNIADLKLSGSYSSSSVRLILAAPFVEAGPYKVGGVDVESDQLTATDKPEEAFMFDLQASSRREITVDHQTFIVTLLSSRILSVPLVAHAYQYTFGVHEK